MGILRFLLWTRLVRDYGKKKHLFGVIKQITRGAARYSWSRKSCAP
jgi:hypothetical protein